MKLQKLPYLLERNGEVIRVCYEPDPRPAVVASFKRINEGFAARIVDAKTARKWERKLAAERTAETK